MLLDALEVSTLVVALPSIGSGLRAPPGTTAWFVAAFAISFGLGILPGAALTRRLGARNVYLPALLLYALASLASGAVQAAAFLIALRVVKGLCVALTAPTGL